MLRPAREYDGFELCAHDGHIGHVADLFFDDRRWTIRYFVVDTGTWLDHREVLIAPASVTAPDWKERLLRVALSKEQVRQSPGVDPDDELTRDEELALAQYYNWPMYWGSAGFSDGLIYAMPPFLPADAQTATRSPRTTSTLDEQHHIRSADDVRGYRVHTNDGEIGHVEDFLVDDETWRIGHLILATRNWLPGKRVLLAPEWIYEVGWRDGTVYVDLTREAIRRSPAYEPGRPFAAEYTDRLSTHQVPPERRNAEP